MNKKLNIGDIVRISRVGGITGIRKYKFNGKSGVEELCEWLGIIEKVIANEFYGPDKNGIWRDFSEISYGVRVSSTGDPLILEENRLEPSKVKLHKDAYQAKPGQEILVNGEHYLVEKATEDYFQVESVHDGPQWDSRWLIQARKKTEKGVGDLETFQQVGIDNFKKYLRGNTLFNSTCLR